MLGRGGMGVYKAEDTALGIPVALKSITAGMTTDAAFVRRFRTEARAMARVASPHIVRVMALRETEHGFFIVMEYVDGGACTTGWPPGRWRGGTCGRCSARCSCSRPPTPSAWSTATSSPQRPVDDDTVKLTDFGLARLQSDGDATRTQAVAGTLAYMSPEQVRCSRRSTTAATCSRSTAYEALVAAPVRPRRRRLYHDAVVEDLFPPLTSFDDRVLPAAAAALMRALEKDPDRRYASAADARGARGRRRRRDPDADARPRAPGPAARAPGRRGRRRPAARRAPGLACRPGRRRAHRAGAAGPGLVAVAPGHADARPARRRDLLRRPGAGRGDRRGGGRHGRGCVANGVSATAEVEWAGASRRVACALPTSPSTCRRNGAAEDATVSVDGAEPVALPTRLSLATGVDTLRVASDRIDTLVTVEVLPTSTPRCRRPRPSPCAPGGPADDRRADRRGHDPAGRDDAGGSTQGGATGAARRGRIDAGRATRPPPQTVPPRWRPRGWARWRWPWTRA